GFLPVSSQRRDIALSSKTRAPAGVGNRSNAGFKDEADVKRAWLRASSRAIESNLTDFLCLHDAFPAANTDSTKSAPTKCRSASTLRPASGYTRASLAGLGDSIGPIRHLAPSAEGTSLASPREQPAPDVSDAGPGDLRVAGSCVCPGTPRSALLCDCCRHSDRDWQLGHRCE